MPLYSIIKQIFLIGYNKFKINLIRYLILKKLFINKHKYVINK